MEESNNRALLEYAEQVGGAKLVRLGGEAGPEAVLLPKGKTLQSVKPLLDEYRERPERRQGTARFSQLASFIEHATRFKGEHSVIFASEDPKSPALTSVLDYHHAGESGPAAWCKHRGVYAFPLSDEWQAWMRMHDRELSQEALAEFLEGRMLDVLDPAAVGESTRDLADRLGIGLVGPARIMETARGLSIRVDAKVTNAVNLSTGEGAIAYEETHSDKAGGPLKVPGGFVIGIPVFRGEALYQLVVRLRYRVKGGAITWRLLLQRHEEAFRDAFVEACNEAANETGLPLFYGTPEA